LLDGLRNKGYTHVIQTDELYQEFLSSERKKKKIKTEMKNKCARRLDS